VILLVLVGFGLVKLIALPFGGASTAAAILLGILLIVAILGVLALVGRYRQRRAQAKIAAGGQR
jgi:hypothetical protein